MTIAPKNEKKIKSQHDAGFDTRNAFWMCYRCNLTFNEESTVELHNKITKHSARKIEFSQGRGVVA